MCDNCSNDPKFTSKPGTKERMAELDARTHELILEHGHQITGVIPEEGKPGFFYTVGRSVFDRPELLLTGNLPSRQAMNILNSIAFMENEDKIVIADLADGEPVRLEGFGCDLRFVPVNAYECEMFGATRLAADPDIEAYQVIWPDAAGLWPEDEDYAYGPDAQPVHALP
jgi:hypothetical protein